MRTTWKLFEVLNYTQHRADHQNGKATSPQAGLRGKGVSSLEPNIHSLAAG